MSYRQGMPLVNIVRAIVTLEDDSKKSYMFDTAQEATIDPYVSEGEENILRIKNKIVATDKTEDLVAGYDITLSSNTLIPELLEIIDGGELIYEDGEDSEVIGYMGPASGRVVKRKKFTLDLFTEEKDADGEVKKYVQFTFKHCVGTPLSFTLQDGEFFIPEMICKSRPKTCERPMYVLFLDELPGGEIVEPPCPLPEFPEPGTEEPGTGESGTGEDSGL